MFLFSSNQLLYESRAKVIITHVPSTPDTCEIHNCREVYCQSSPSAFCFVWLRKYQLNPNCKLSPVKSRFSFLLQDFQSPSSAGGVVSLSYCPRQQSSPIHRH